MPRFFVDFRDGETVQVDDIGDDVDSFEHVRNAAISMLSQVARDMLPDGEHREFSVTVKNEQNFVLYRATLTFHGEHFAPAT